MFFSGDGDILLLKFGLGSLFFFWLLIKLVHGLIKLIHGTVKNIRYKI